MRARLKPSIVIPTPRTSLATGNTIFSISSSLMIFFLPQVLFPLQGEPYFQTLVLLTQKTRRFDSSDYFYQTSQRLARHALFETSPNQAVFPCNATIFPRVLCFPTGHATFRPMSRPAPPTDLMPGKRRMYSLGF